MIEASRFLEEHPVPCKADALQAQRSTEQTASEREDELDTTQQGDAAESSHTWTRQQGNLRQARFGQRPSDDSESRRSLTHKRRSGRLPTRGGFDSRGFSNAAVAIDNPLDEDACKEAALTLLDSAARPRTALVDRLLAKGYDPAVVDRVADRLEELGFLDDLAYAQSYLQYCLARNLGESGTYREMIRKGLPRQTAQAVVAQAAQEGLFVDAAYALGRKLACKSRGLDLQVRKRRLWSAGGRKGHSPSLIQQVAADLLCDGAENETLTEEV